MLVFESTRPRLIVSRYGTTGVVGCVSYNLELTDGFSGMLHGAMFS